MDFIHESFIPDLNFCDNLISYYKEQESAGNTYEGALISNDLQNTKGDINYNFKKSKEIKIPTEAYDTFGANLQVVTNEYIEKFPWSDKYKKWKVVEVPQIQYYGPNDGFYAWHTERTGKSSTCNNRHLVYMIYLNDVTDGGGTEFLHQEKVFQPVKGKTLIWPADWTYTHRGIPSPTQDKYILTGWYDFIE
jgi:hypothetical protein